MTMTPARIQERIDAPPADFAAVRAPNSQPDPMIEPSEMNISALNPTVRRSPVPVVSTGPSAVVDMDLPEADGGRVRGGSAAISGWCAPVGRSATRTSGRQQCSITRHGGQNG